MVFVPKGGRQQCNQILSTVFVFGAILNTQGQTCRPTTSRNQALDPLGICKACRSDKNMASQKAPL